MMGVDQSALSLWEREGGRSAKPSGKGEGNRPPALTPPVLRASAQCRVGHAPGMAWGAVHPALPVGEGM